jgi:thiol-disulfide isomerase/thioredoxin
MITLNVNGMRRMYDETSRVRRRILGSALTTIAAPGILMSGSARAQNESLPRATRLRVEGEMPSLGGATGWLNTSPLTAAGLRGKVVLIDVWTYTCINWLRTLPYVRAWAEKYKTQGLVVVGVHTPEFEFEKNVDNIRRAVTAMKVTYPVAIDSNFAIWRALRNNYWPALYLVDAKGRIRFHHHGEGEYAQSEAAIRQLLSEAGAGGLDGKAASVEASGLEVAADWDNLRSPETYVGYAQARNFASRGGAARDKRNVYALPARLGLNEWALSGDWTVKKGFAALNAPNGRIAFRFHARDVHLVMGLPVPGAAVRFRVFIDGQPVRADRGSDVDEAGNGKLAEQRLYQLTRQNSAIQERLFEIEFLDPGAEAYCFTFG